MNRITSPSPQNKNLSASFQSLLKHDYFISQKSKQKIMFN